MVKVIFTQSCLRSKIDFPPHSHYTDLRFIGVNQIVFDEDRKKVMPELRQNLATKEWVIIATERAKRPQAYVESGRYVVMPNQVNYDLTCPFCVGNEELDLEIARWPVTGDWQVRTIHNKYPALLGHEALLRRFDGVWRQISGVGYHEIVVEHPHHNTTLALMSAVEIEAVLEMFYNRGWSIRDDPRIKQIIYFKNHGENAGASLHHPHSQIIGLPIVPNYIRQHSEEAQRFFDDTGECVFCVTLDAELDEGERLVAVSEHFVAFVLYAAPSPFYMWIMPRQHTVSFPYTHAEERADLAKILRGVLRKLYFGLHNPAYNLIIRSAPAYELGNDYLHWHVTIIPRLSQPAGFELGSGMYINPTLPEECAAFLREIKVDEGD
jgi:UDPglucose--hexose-1-phosphate uridylyltransferase